MFDFVEETLDEIALAVEREVAQALDDAVGFGRYDNFCTAGFDEVDDGFAVVSLVSQHVFRGDVFQEQFRLGAIGGIARGEDETERIAQGIAQCMQFCGQSATRTADRFRLAIPPFAPALCWCARTMVASIITYSKSGSSAKALNILSQTPFAAQRL